MKQIFILFMLLLVFTQTATAKAVKLGRGNLYSFCVFSSLKASGIQDLTETIGCDANCQTCNSSTGICSACSKDRYVSGNLCLLCPEKSYCDGLTAIANCDGVVCMSNTGPEATEKGCCCIDNCSGVICLDGTSAKADKAGCCCV